jgi:Iap family predicted aminopeptidase
MYKLETNRDRILKITDKNKQARIAKIESCITKSYEVQVAKPGDFPTSSDITNIIIPAKNQKDKIAIMAHHDVFPDSCGYNDNSTGVVTLLKLQNYLPDNFELVFTDGEERGGQGCRYYLENCILPKQAINIDVVGLEGKIFYEMYGKTTFNIPKTLEYYENIPFSDSYILDNYGIPNILMLTGKNKETLIRDIFNAQHCGKYDRSLNLISEDTMDRVADTLLTLIDTWRGA